MVRGILAILAAACITTSCDDADDWSYDGPRSACSTGTPDPNEDFPAITESSPSMPECIPRCGEGKQSLGTYGATFTIDALPRGACEYDGEVCSMSAVRTRTCDDGRTTACSLTGYACRCESGTWRCYRGPVGASACVCSTPPAIEAGTDAAGD